MTKTSLERIYEPAEGRTHFSPPGGLDQVTLCGKTDWIGEEKGRITRKPITCRACQHIVEMIQAARKERFQ